MNPAIPSAAWLHRIQYSSHFCHTINRFARLAANDDVRYHVLYVEHSNIFQLPLKIHANKRPHFTKLQLRLAAQTIVSTAHAITCCRDALQHSVVLVRPTLFFSFALFSLRIISFHCLRFIYSLFGCCFFFYRANDYFVARAATYTMRQHWYMQRVTHEQQQSTES